MKLSIFQRFFRFFWTIYATSVFMFWVVCAFISLSVLTLFTRKRFYKQYLWFLYRIIGKMICVTMFFRVRKKHHFDFSEDESYVVVSNHSAMIDIPANVVSSPEAILFKFLGKKEADRIPILGKIIQAFCILVDRKSKDSRKQSYVTMKREMNKGYSVFLYPEGTRNRTDDLVTDYFDGAFRLAIEMQKPIVVNTLVGIKELNPPSSFFTIRPGIIEAHWDTPIETVGMTLDDIALLKEKVKKVMLNRLESSKN